MPSPSEKTIHAGRQYQASRTVKMLIYNYDQMQIQSKQLTAGSIFQPWDTFNGWRGIKVPISFSKSSHAFDWGLRTGEVHFLTWNDFFSNCKRVKAGGLWRGLKKGFNRIPLNQIRQGQVGIAKERKAKSSQGKILPAKELFDLDNAGRTRLFYAAERGNLDAVEKMIYRFPGTGFAPQRLGFIETKDIEGKRAAEVAEKLGHEAVANALRIEVGRMEYYG